MNFLSMITCLIRGTCDESKPAHQEAVIAETKRRIKAVEDAWEPIVASIEAEQLDRPDLAARLREARRNHERIVE